MATLVQTNPVETEAAASSENVESPIVASPAPEMPTMISQRASWPAVNWLPMQLNVSLPIPKFRVRDLLALDPGQTIATEWPNGDDLPLSIEDVQLAWIEMESVDQGMAVRITRLL